MLLFSRISCHSITAYYTSKNLNGYLVSIGWLIKHHNGRFLALCPGSGPTPPGCIFRSGLLLEGQFQICWFYCLTLVFNVATNLIKPAVCIFVPSHGLSITLARIRPLGWGRYSCGAKPLWPVVLYSNQPMFVVENTFTPKAFHGMVGWGEVWSGLGSCGSSPKKVQGSIDSWLPLAKGH
jgi:hypothetical protein